MEVLGIGGFVPGASALHPSHPLPHPGPEASPPPPLLCSRSSLRELGAEFISPELVSLRVSVPSTSCDPDYNRLSIKSKTPLVLTIREALISPPTNTQDYILSCKIQHSWT